MRHIQPFSLNESNDQAQVNPIGFILYLRNRWYYGAFPTFHDFACKVYKDFTSESVDEEFFGEVFDLKQAMWDATDDSDEALTSDINNMIFWWGFTPKCAPNTLLAYYLDGNPYGAAKSLDMAFSDVNPVMTKWPNGRDADAGFIGRSIQNDHSQLELYLNRVDEDSYFSKEDIIGSIPTDIPKTLQSLIKYHKIKGLI
jgi:hypothetical protein